MIRVAHEKQYFNLERDLQTECYTTLLVLESLCDEAGFAVEFSLCNRFV